MNTNRNDKLADKLSKQLVEIYNRSSSLEEANRKAEECIKSLFEGLSTQDGVDILFNCCACQAAQLVEFGKKFNKMLKDN